MTAVSILTGPLRPVLRLPHGYCRGSPRVSILTGPLRPVLPDRAPDSDSEQSVSILTGPLRPVLRVSLAEYIRRLVDQDLAAPARSVDRSIVFDLGTSEGTDIALEKDHMIGEAVGAGTRRHPNAP